MNRTLGLPSGAAAAVCARADEGTTQSNATENASKSVRIMSRPLYVLSPAASMRNAGRMIRETHMRSVLTRHRARSR